MIYTLFPIVISSDIKKLKKLKHLSCDVANPEVLLKTPIWNSLATPADVMILCKLRGKSQKFFDKNYNRPKYHFNCRYYNYDFTIDSTITLYNRDGDTVCTGRYNEDYTRVGIWRYYCSSEIIEAIHDDNGKIIEYSIIDLHREIVTTNKFDLKNNENYYKRSFVNTYRKGAYFGSDTIITGEELLKFDRVNNIIYKIDAQNNKEILDFKNKLYYENITYNGNDVTSFMCYKFARTGSCLQVMFNLNIYDYNAVNETFCYGRKRNSSIYGREHKRIIQEKEFINNKLSEFEDLENYFKTN